ncbi:MAG TPA: hypothetical protein VKB43_08400 [Gaiellaceae bacterium]|nr:hypothetical protein [Gaiellaceae bacterium]
MQFAATIAVVVSVLVLATQTRAVWREERVANQVAGTRAHRELLNMLGDIHDKFFEHPELRNQFFGKSTTQPTASELIRLQVIAERLADTLQVALDTTVKLASYDWVTSEWRQYAVESVAASPILRATIRERPGIWTPLEAMVAEYDAKARPDENARWPNAGRAGTLHAE